MAAREHQINPEKVDPSINNTSSRRTGSLNNSELLLTPEQRAQRLIDLYMPSTELLAQFETKPNPELRRLEAKNEKEKPGADLMLMWSHLENRMVVVPPNHPYTQVGRFAHSLEYAGQIFEGSRSVLHPNGKAYLILAKPRADRMFDFSAPGRTIKLPVTKEAYMQQTLDYLALLGRQLYQPDPKKPVASAYVRPDAGRGVNALGVPSLPSHEVDMSEIAWYWPSYVPEILYKEGATVALMPSPQRLVPIDAKGASNYAEAGKQGEKVKQHGAGEALLFSGITIDTTSPLDSSKWHSINLQGPEYKNLTNAQFAKVIEDIALADGPGEGLMGMRPDGTLVIPPDDVVNSLPSTTIAYIRDYLAPSLGIPVVQEPFSLRSIKEGKIQSIGFAGNAIKVLGIKDIQIRGRDGVSIIGNVHMDIHPEWKRLQQAFLDELDGRKIPAGAHFLTEIDLEAGEIAREKFKRVFASYMK